MKLKMDDKGNVVIQDGNPVYVHEDGSEAPFDAAGALAKAREASKEAKVYRLKAKDLEGKASAIDPDEYDRLKQEAEQREQERLEKKSKFDEILKKREAGWEGDKAKYEDTIKAKDAKLRKFYLDDKVRAAAIKSGVLLDDLEDVLILTARNFDLDENNNPMVIDKDGDPAGMDPLKYFEKFKEKKPKFFKSDATPGSGQKPGYKAPPVDTANMTSRQKIAAGLKKQLQG